MEQHDKFKIKSKKINQSTIYLLLKNLYSYNDVYRNAGAVHGCALCQNSKPLIFIEDVGRHNAVE